jgi:hypothetical protein
MHAEVIASLDLDVYQVFNSREIEQQRLREEPHQDKQDSKVPLELLNRPQDSHQQPEGPQPHLKDRADDVIV